jgi:hypothetical protein
MDAFTLVDLISVITEVYGLGGALHPAYLAAHALMADIVCLLISGSC